MAQPPRTVCSFEHAERERAPMPTSSALLPVATGRFTLSAEQLMILWDRRAPLKLTVGSCQMNPRCDFESARAFGNRGMTAAFSTPH